MKEEEIRPKRIFDEFRRLAELDAEKYFGADGREHVCCPACGLNGLYSFTKHTFVYEECPACQTLFANPRPPVEAFSLFYRESESAKYVASTFYKETAEARREKIWRPKAKMLSEIIKRFGADQHDMVDVGGGYGIFAEEYGKISGKQVTVIEPGSALADACRGKGLKVIQGFLEDIGPGQLPDSPKVFVSFELFEHLHTPEKFLQHLGDLMLSGDMFIFTTLSGAGVDIQALWEDSKSVSPPHHLNFFNPKSARILLERAGFDVLQTSTPGKLDIDILYNNQQYIKDRFWRTFIIQSGENERQAMQSFIAENGLSSHMLVVCRKP